MFRDSFQIYLNNTRKNIKRIFVQYTRTYAHNTQVSFKNRCLQTQIVTVQSTGQKMILTISFTLSFGLVLGFGREYIRHTLSLEVMWILRDKITRKNSD